MRITFFGSSHGRPEPHRKCSCSLLEVGSRKYLIDLGTNPVDELINRGIPVASITACFVTHMHGDHLDGIIPYVDLMSWAYTSADPAIYLPKAGAAESIKNYIQWTGSKYRDSLRFFQIEEGCFYRDDCICVTAARTGHCDVSYSFLIEAEGRRVLFTGDMKEGDGPTADYDRIIGDRHFDLVIAECAHFDAGLYREPLLRNTPGRFVLNHYSSRYHESCLHLKKELSGQIPVELATDGMVIDL